jgi:hydrogenase nickel incorporation protein HypB
MQRIRVVKEALDANNTIARANRQDFDRADVTVVNLMSAPGAGKTTLLERTLARFEERRATPIESSLRVGIIEGDVHGNLDAQRLAEFHVPVVQINTDGGFGGECHLDANMVRSALPSMPLDDIDLLMIENVGNLVCPAEFRVGEDHRVMITAVTEGEDKPIKYPLMFRACELVIVNKIDLLPHLDVDLSNLLANIADVHPGVPCLLTSARTGEGIDAWCRWLTSARRAQPAMT